jgi:chromosome segregation ATPase
MKEQVKDMLKALDTQGKALEVQFARVGDQICALSEQRDELVHLINRLEVQRQQITTQVDRMKSQYEYLCGQLKRVESLKGQLQDYEEVDYGSLN